MSKDIDILSLQKSPKCARLKDMFNWKKSYFKEKVRGIEKMIEDLLFKRYKTLYTREEIRQEYDNCRATLEVKQTNIRAQSEAFDKLPIGFKKELTKEDGTKDLETTRQFLDRNKEYFEKNPDQRNQYDEFGRLEDDIVRLNAEIERKIAQMKQLDVEVNGSPRTNEYPDGHQGLNQTLEALQKLKELTKIYAKNL